MRYRSLWGGPIVLFVCLLAAFAARPAGAGEAITLLLRWDHQFQFAGYYAALWRGYYADAGLDVTIRTPFKGELEILDSIEEVVAGRSDFGIGGVDILVARDKGRPVVAVATIFQESAAEYYIRRDSGFDSIADLPRLRAARRPNDLLDIEFQAMLLAEGIDPNLVKPFKPYGSENDIANGVIDLIPGYSFVTSHLLDSKGVDYIRLRPRDFGIHFYGDTLFTREDMIRRNANAVDKFAAASLRGWEYALEHPSEIADLIAEKLERRFPVLDPVAFNHAQIDGILKSTLFPLVEPGHMNPGRWQHMHDWLQMAGLTANPIDLDKFIYDPAKRREQFQRYVIELLALFVVLALALGTVAWIWSLRRAVRTKTADLILSQQHLADAQKLATLGQLTATVSHELRNPLGVIRSGISVLANRVHGGDELIDRTLERIDRSIARCDRIVSELLDFTRTPELPLEPTRLDAWLSETLDEVGVPPGIDVVRDFNAVDVRVPIDRERLHRAIINVQENACQAMQVSESKRLSVRTLVSNGLACIEFADTGPGMDAATLDKAFEPLFSTKSFGIGLGLPTVRQIMAGHAGDIDIDSAPGSGTTVRLWLPVCH